MPSKFPWSRTDRSKASVSYSSEQSSQTQSRQDAYDPQAYPPPPFPGNQYADSPQVPAPYEHPQRLQSRNPQVNLVVPEGTNEGSYEAYRSQPNQPEPSHDPRDHDGRRGLRQRLGLGSSRENISEGTEGSSKLSLGRRVSVSVRKKDSPGSSQQQFSDRPPAGEQWQSSRPHSPQLSTAHEEDNHIRPGNLYHQRNDSFISTAPSVESRGSVHNASIPPPLRNPSRPDQNQVRRNSDTNDQGNPPQYLSQASTNRPINRPYEQVEESTALATRENRAPEYTPSAESSLARQPSVLRKQQPMSGIRQQRQGQPADGSKVGPAPQGPREPNPTPQRQVQRIPEEQGPTGNGMSPNSTTAGPKAQQLQEGEGGRQTPPLARPGNGTSDQEYAALFKEYKEIRDKYSKLKKYYAVKEEQVKTLQNTLAHQRLSQSRTALDDGEYVTRLTRLDGLISQLAFGFRKDWRTLPSWLHSSINKDAIALGKQEMIAAGRAFVSKWLVDEVFDKYFHPGLDIALSLELKNIQHNIRRYCPPFQSGEEEEALLAKIINWRLSTIDGLQHQLSLQDVAARTNALVDLLIKQLVSDLQEHMIDPPPAGLEGGVHMIIELAVGILANLPRESRDVHIEYFPPLCPIYHDIMRVESGMPPLTTPISPGPEQYHEGFDGGSAVETKDGGHTTTTEDEASSLHDQSKEGGNTDQHGKKGFFGGLMGNNKKHGISGPNAPKHASAANSSTSLAQPPGSSAGPKEERNRLCVFLALQIRGKAVLMKAPVYRT